MAKKSKRERLEVSEGRVVGMYYVLRNDEGEVLDSNKGRGAPLSFLCGAGNIVKGLEKELLGAFRDDLREVTVAPEDGYGVPNAELMREVPRDSFPPEMELQLGLTVRGKDPQGQPIAARIKEIREDTVLLDQNHPLAGLTLHFAVTIAGVREATDSERQHGHPHGPGGHQH